MDKAPMHTPGPWAVTKGNKAMSRVTRWLTVWVVIGSIVMILTERVL